MVELLTGKCIWVDDDFNSYTTNNNKFEHTVAKIEDGIIDENIIQFTIPNPGYLDRSYSVKLIRNDNGSTYKNISGYIEITCEKFEGDNKLILYGKWIEETLIYSWWAIFDLKPPGSMILLP